MFILDNLNQVCTDYALAGALSIIYQVLKVICLIVPILLIISLALSLVSMMTNPDQKNGLKKMLLKVAAAVVIFFLPRLITVVINWLPDDQLDVIVCLQEAVTTSKSLENAKYKEGISAPNAGLMGNLSKLRKHASKNKNETKDESPKEDESDLKRLYIKTTKFNRYQSRIPVYKGSTKAAKVLNGAMEYVGGPYLWNGGHENPSLGIDYYMTQSPVHGVDCSAFVGLILQKYAGITYDGGDNTSFLSKGQAVENINKAQPGDLIIYTGHIGIYMGDNKIVHAQNTLTGIVQGTDVHYNGEFSIRRVL